MPQEVNQNSYTAPVRQPQKSYKEKTMATGHTTSLAQIDVTKPLSLEEQALIASNEDSLAEQNIGINGLPGYYPGKYYSPATQTENETEGTSYIVKEGEEISTIAKDNGITSEELINANLDKLYGTDKKYFKAGDVITVPEKKAVVKEDTEELKNTDVKEIPQATEKPVSEIKPEIEIKEKPAKVESAIPESEKKVEEPVNEEKKAEGYISSFVGEYTSAPDKSKIANLGKDVAFVQQHLNRLGILSDADYNAEKVTSFEEINKNQIPKTIEAIDWFQSKALHYDTRFGYVDPTGGTIKQLVLMTVEQKDAKFLEYTKKKEAAEKKASEDKAKAAEEAKKAKAEAEKKEKERIRIEKISHELPTLEKLEAHFNSCNNNIEEFGKSLKEYALHNPLFTLMAYEVLRDIKSDNLTCAIMNNMSDSEIAQLHFVVDDHFYDTLYSGITFEDEYALMAKLRKGKEKTVEGVEKKEVKVSRKTKKEAIDDLHKISEVIRYELRGSVGGSEDKKGDNYPEDVKQVAYQLKKKGIAVSDKSLIDGEYDEVLKEAIGTFQLNKFMDAEKEKQAKIEAAKIEAAKKETDKKETVKKEVGVKENKEEAKIEFTPDYIIRKDKEDYKDLFGTKTFKSGLTDIYGSRNNFTKYIVDSKLTGSVGKNAKNAPNDVSLVKEKLEEKNFKVESDKLSDLIIKIEAFQGTFLKKANIDGNISSIGLTAQNLGLATPKGGIGKLDRSQTSKGKYEISKGTDEADYYLKVDLLNKNILKDTKNIEKVLVSAKKAAADDNYFLAFTTGLNSKLNWDANPKDPPVKEIEGNKLSFVLEERMRKFHKFCVAIGLYEGDMVVSNAVRAETTSHKWSVEHFILYNHNQNHWESIKTNLVEMYNNPKYRDGKNVKDLHGFVWAKQEHFIFDEKDKEKTKATGINLKNVQDFVQDFNYRNNKKSIAAEGYISGDERLPLPTTGNPGRSNHISGDAIDIDSWGFIDRDDAIIDLIALNFGVIRCASGEQWHFECTDLRVSSSEQELVEHNKR